MDNVNVCVVSDDSALCDSIRNLIETAGMNGRFYDSLHAYCNVVTPKLRGCLVFDTHNFDLSEVSQRSTLEAVCTKMSVILITDRGDVATAVSGMKLGAVDVVQKPYRRNRLLDSVKHVIEEKSCSN